MISGRRHFYNFGKNWAGFPISLVTISHFGPVELYVHLFWRLKNLQISKTIKDMKNLKVGKESAGEIRLFNWFKVLDVQLEILYEFLKWARSQLPRVP